MKYQLEGTVYIYFPCIREIWRFVHPRKVVWLFRGWTNLHISLMQGKWMFYSTRPTFWWILNNFFQTSLLVLWFWYYMVYRLKWLTYFYTRNWRKHLTAAAVLFLVLIESLFNKSSSISLSSAKWNLLAIFVCKIIISEHLWSYLY